MTDDDRFPEAALRAMAENYRLLSRVLHADRREYERRHKLLTDACEAYNDVRARCLLAELTLELGHAPAPDYDAERRRAMFDSHVRTAKDHATKETASFNDADAAHPQATD